MCEVYMCFKMMPPSVSFSIGGMSTPSKNLTKKGKLLLQFSVKCFSALLISEDDIVILIPPYQFTLYFFGNLKLYGVFLLDYLMLDMLIFNYEMIWIIARFLRDDLITLITRSLLLFWFNFFLNLNCICLIRMFFMLWVPFLEDLSNLIKPNLKKREQGGKNVDDSGKNDGIDHEIHILLDMSNDNMVD
ncbi:hypothetical protein IEQ34_007862 [Dendrobium chrysotoxum]|uniref:Uncharacterized protein n=1 Tax=Dendrobium chrysotoxum TaxID=161865 RepID=A0AAV7H6X2_DENCH|nr:hypothetical protein IEQ34_007862 [Dendrobium chrysotoxum]